MGTFRPSNKESWCELLILADGTVLAHNLTEKLAEILSRVAPYDASLRHRALGSKKNLATKNAKNTKSEGTDANGS